MNNSVTLFMLIRVMTENSQRIKGCLNIVNYEVTIQGMFMN